MFRNLRELYRYRGLVWALVLRHLATRYRGSLLGFLWSFLNPLCLMLVYVLVFRFYIRFDQVEHYTVFVFCGLLPWLWLTSSLQEGTSSIVASGHLITKSMFPAHILPAVSVITNLINFLLSIPILLVFMWALGVKFYSTLLLVPVLVIVQCVFLYGATLALGALNVHFRDVQHIVGNLLTFLFFLCPIIYPVETVPERFRFTLDYNPLALITSFYHKLVLDGALPGSGEFLYVLAASIIMLLAGLGIFNRYRESFAEVL